MIRSLLTVVTGAGICAVYFYLYNKAVSMTRQLAPGVGQGVLLFGYLGRLAVVGVLLVLSTRVAGLDPFLTALSFLVTYTVALLYTQGQAGLALLRGLVSERKE